MSPKLHEFAVTLKRDGQCTPWGIRLVGGNDLDTPLIITRVQVGTPAYGEVLRGDIIAKIGEYDARDVSHADAQMLFRTAGNEIRVVVRRDNKIAYTQGLSGDNSVASPALLSTSPEQNAPHRSPSPFVNGPGHYERALQVPVDTLPHTVFPKLNTSGGYVAPPEGGSFSPMPTRDHQQEVAEEQATIVNQKLTIIFCLFPKFANMDFKAIIDALGVCKEIGKLQIFTSRTISKEFKKPNLVLIDSSDTGCYFNRR
uniref:PDZ domain-containing protein n=1 Tax=Glossina brevipalpis TaxID=37001 RepID=A0A1A9X360_9MUSC